MIKLNLPLQCEGITSIDVRGEMLDVDLECVNMEALIEHLCSCVVPQAFMRYITDEVLREEFKVRGLENE